MNNEDRLIAVLDSIMEFQSEILTVLRDEGIKIKKEYSKNTYSAPLTQEDFDDLDEEIDLEWWFEIYGEESQPAKRMNKSGHPFSKKEKDYLHRRLVEIASCIPEVNNGTHTFKFLGKKYCPTDHNTLNCFACVPNV